MKPKVAAAAPPPAQPSLEYVLRDLEEKNSQLAKMDLRISESISRVEELLGTRVSVRVGVPIDEGGGYSASEYLAFAKHKGAWVLAVEERDYSGEVRNRTPLSSCSREKRADMFAGGHIEALIRNAHQDIEEELKTRSVAIEVMDRLVAMLPPPPEQPSNSQEASDDDIPF